MSEKDLETLKNTFSALDKNEKLEVLKVFDTEDLLDELEDRYKDMEVKLSKIYDVMKG